MLKFINLNFKNTCKLYLYQVVFYHSVNVKIYLFKFNKLNSHIKI